jgi:hypothetical protein
VANFALSGVAPISKSAVSRVSKPADGTTSSARPIENRRHSRFGNLRYDFGEMLQLSF